MSTANATFKNFLIPILPKTHFSAVMIAVSKSNLVNVCVTTDSLLENIFNLFVFYLMATSHNDQYGMKYINTNSRKVCYKEGIMLTSIITSMNSHSPVGWSLDSPLSIDSPLLLQISGFISNKGQAKFLILTMTTIIKTCKLLTSQNLGAAPKNIKYKIGPHGLTSTFFSNTAAQRFIPFDDLEKIAKETMIASRTLPMFPEHSMLFQAYVPCHWGSDASVHRGQKEVSPESLVTSIVDRPPAWSSKHHDKELMQKFMKNSLSQALVINEQQMKFEHVLPNRFSLLDCAIARSELLDTWATSVEGSVHELLCHFQKWKSLKPALLDEVVVNEIIVGVTPEKEIQRILKWVSECHDQDQRWCPLGVMSMDIEEVRIRTVDFERILKNSAEINCKPIRITRWPSKGESCTQLPVKIMLGNGFSWALMVSVSVIPVSGGKYEVGNLQFQPSVVEFLKNLPILVGVGIRLDVLELVELVRRTSDESFQMKGWTDLSTLALLAGWNFPRYNMQAMSVQVLGSIMNKSVSRGDGEWGLPWAKIDDALKVYCLGDLKFGHMTAVVLSLLSLWDIFPDPDVVCSFTRKAPWQFAGKFFDWVFTALAGTEVDPRGLDAARSRAELVDCIRTRSVHHVLSAHAPSRVAVLGKILGSWPSIRFGGPRYLHQVRTHFLSQCQILTDSMCEQWEEIMPHDFHNREMWECATYAVVPLEEKRWSAPDGSRGLSLAVHQDLMLQTLICPGARISSVLIRELAKKYQRNKREMVMEWIRLNLSDLLPYFKRVEKDPWLSRFAGSYYVEARMIFRRCTGKSAPRLASIDARRKEVALADAQVELDAIDRAKQIVENAKKVIAVRELRYDYQAEKYADDDSHWSTISWRGQLPGSKVELENKYSRNDLRAIFFNEACDKDEVLDRKDVDLVLNEEYWERRHCEPLPKKRKHSEFKPATATSSQPVPEWAVERKHSPSNKVYTTGQWDYVGDQSDCDLELGIQSDELHSFQ